MLFTQPVLASVDGTFSGSTLTELTCSAPLVTEPAEPTSITISLSTGISGGIVNSVTMSSSHFTFTSSSAGSYTDSPQLDGSIDVTGSISGTLNVTSGSGFDGPNIATFSFESNFNNGTLTLNIVTSVSYSGSCTGGGNVNFTSLPATLTSSVSGIDIIVDPAITPGTIITTPQILNTEVKAITSDLQQRINDFLRTIKLSRQRGGAEGFPGRIPPGGVPPDQRDKDRDKGKEEDTQASLPVQRTQTGFMMNSLTGLNAGDNSYLMGAWASYSYVDFNNDFAATAFDGRRHGGLTGVDISPRESILLGLALGYEDTDINTDFNRGNQQTDGFTVAPYLGYLLTDTWSLSASIGYSSLNTDQFRTVPGTTTRVTSSPDHDRWFATVNLDGLTTYGNWVLGGQLGFLYALDAQDSFVESDGTQVTEFDSRLGQVNVTGEVAYSWGTYEPFARFTYESDLKQTKVGVISGPQPSFDEDDVLLGFGVRYFGLNNLTGNLEINTRLGREDYDEYSLTGTIRYEW